MYITVNLLYLAMTLVLQMFGNIFNMFKYNIVNIVKYNKTFVLTCFWMPCRTSKQYEWNVHKFCHTMVILQWFCYVWK